jgi:hypothetical protein
MRTREMAQGIDHGDHHEREGKRNPNVRNGASAIRVDHDCAWPNEDEKERPERFSRRPASDGSPG